MEERSYNRKVLFGSLLMLLVIAGFGASAYWLKNDMTALAGKISNIRNAAAANANSLEVLARLKQGSEEIDEYQKQIEQILPIEDKLILLKSWLEQVASGPRVSVASNLEMSGTAQDGLPAFSYFTIVANGDYSALILFMREIESRSTSYLISLETMDITRQSDKYQLVAKGRVYYKHTISDKL